MRYKASSEAFAIMKVVESGSFSEERVLRIFALKPDAIGFLAMLARKKSRQKKNLLELSITENEIRARDAVCSMRIFVREIEVY